VQPGVAALVLLLAAMAFGCAGGAGASSAATMAPGASDPEHASGPASDDATTHHSFSDPEKWAKVFDDPGRDEWQKPGEVVKALGVKPGMTAADLGAGTGYFMAALSQAAGSGGVVLEIDTEPEMVGYLAKRAKKEALLNVVPVLALDEEPFLPKGRVDRVLIVDTYHHIDDRRAYFTRMRQSLTPGGRVAVVDFHKRPLPVGPPPEHKLEREVVVHEMEQAGYRLADEPTFLPYQYFLIFAPSQTADAAAHGA
jgi:ubiquinone/menaquinone biosynthesis C-methylase UbiE